VNALLFSLPSDLTAVTEPTSPHDGAEVDGNELTPMF